MTFDEKFVQAALLRPPKVLGVQLRPYCAGHALLLDALDFLLRVLELAVVILGATGET